MQSCAVSCAVSHLGKVMLHCHLNHLAALACTHLLYAFWNSSQETQPSQSSSTSQIMSSTSPRLGCNMRHRGAHDVKQCI